MRQFQWEWTHADGLPPPGRPVADPRLFASTQVSRPGGIEETRSRLRAAFVSRRGTDGGADTAGTFGARLAAVGLGCDEGPTEDGDFAGGESHQAGVEGVGDDAGFSLLFVPQQRILRRSVVG